MVARHRFFIAAIALAAVAGVVRTHAGVQPAAAGAALRIQTMTAPPARLRTREASSAAECAAPKRRPRKSRAHHSRRHIAAAEPATRVDVNRASVEELETLPGIGERLAERIVAFRDQNGPFLALDELLDVNGISERALSELEPYVELRR